jgi:hypothetical protein
MAFGIVGETEKMEKFLQRIEKRVKPYHLLHGMFLIIIVAGVIFRLLK